MLFTNIKYNETHVHIIIDITCVEYRHNIRFEKINTTSNIIAINQNKIVIPLYLCIKNYFNSSKQILINNLPFNTKSYREINKTHPLFDRIIYTKKMYILRI